MQNLTDQEKAIHRTMALKLSRELHPNIQTGFQTQPKTPSVMEVLKDAQTIYKWLIEGENNEERTNR